MSSSTTFSLPPSNSTALRDAYLKVFRNANLQQFFVDNLWMDLPKIIMLTSINRECRESFLNHKPWIVKIVRKFILDRACCQDIWSNRGLLEDIADILIKERSQNSIDDVFRISKKIPDPRMQASIIKKIPTNKVEKVYLSTLVEKIETALSIKYSNQRNKKLYGIATKRAKDRDVVAIQDALNIVDRIGPTFSSYKPLALREIAIQQAKQLDENAIHLALKIAKKIDTDLIYRDKFGNESQLGRECFIYAVNHIAIEQANRTGENSIQKALDLLSNLRLEHCDEGICKIAIEQAKKDEENAIEKALHILNGARSSHNNLMTLSKISVEQAKKEGPQSAQKAIDILRKLENPDEMYQTFLRIIKIQAKKGDANAVENALKCVNTIEPEVGDERYLFHKSNWKLMNACLHLIAVEQANKGADDSIQKAIEITKNIDSQLFRNYALSDISLRQIELEAPDALQKALEIAQQIDDNINEKYKCDHYEKIRRKNTLCDIAISQAKKDEDNAIQRALSVIKTVVESFDEIDENLLNLTKIAVENTLSEIAIEQSIKKDVDALQKALDITKDIQNRYCYTVALVEIAANFHVNRLPPYRKLPSEKVSNVITHFHKIVGV